MKKLMNGVLAAILILGTLVGYQTPKAMAVDTEQELKIHAQLEGWVLDEIKGSIYALTDEGNVLIISRETFEITNKVSLGATQLSDLDLEGDTLWVSMQDQNKVAKVNLLTFEVDEMISLSQSPYSIEVLDGKLYYAYDQHSEVRIVDLFTKEETFLDVPELNSDTFYEPDLISNEPDVLYVAESGSSGSDIYKISLTDGSILSQSTFDEGYGFSYPKRKVFTDDDEVFYAARSLKKEDLTQINGFYGGTITGYTDQFVFSETAIFDRDEFHKVSDLPFETEFLLVPSMNEIYMFDSNRTTIHKEGFELPTTLETGTYTNFNQKLILNANITDWALDDVNGKIYAISKLTNTLFTIDSTTFTVEEEQTVVSLPSDIDLVNQKIYISGSGSTFVEVIDLSTGAKSKVKTNQNPYRIATDGNTLFYVLEDAWTKVYKVDLANNSESVIAEGLRTNKYMYSDPDIEFNGENGTLYIAESASSGSHLFALNTNDILDVRQTDYDDGYGFSFPKRKVVVDGQYVYYAKQKISETDLTNEMWNYNEDILNVSTDYVISTKGVYAKTNDMVKAATFPYTVAHASINKEGNVFLYVPENQSIYKFNSVQNLIDGKPSEPSGEVDEENKFQLRWDGATADHYKLSYKTEDMTESQPLGPTDLVDTQFTIAEADHSKWAGHTLTFYVQSVVGTYTSEKVPYTYTFKPNVPPNFSVTKDGDNNLVFKWDEVKADFYKLYYQTGEMSEALPIGGTVENIQFTLAEENYQQWIGENVTFSVQAFAKDKQSGIAKFQSVIDDTPGEIVPTDLQTIEKAGIEASGTANQKIYKYKQNNKNITLNIHEAIIKEMNGTGEEAFYVESQSGSFKLPINTIDAYSNEEDSYIQVTIKKVYGETLQSISEIAEQQALEMLSHPIDFSVHIVENGKSSKVTSYGKEFVERRIPIKDPSTTENLTVVVLDPIKKTYQSVPTKIEQDENGQYWAVFYRNGNSIYSLVKAPVKHFTDTVDHWSKDYIDELVSRLIVNGVSETEFKPERSVNRAEFAAMITRALGLLADENANKNIFHDVDESKWYSEVVQAAYEANLIKGYTDGSFRPSDTLTREEMITMSIRALEMVNGDQVANTKVLSKFKDGNKVSSWAKESLSIAIAQNIVNGKTKDTLAPTDEVTRAESATVISRLLTKLKFNE